MRRQALGALTFSTNWLEIAQGSNYFAATSPQLSGKIVYQGPVKAPIKAGAHIADLIVSSPGLPDQTMPLTAARDVGEAGFFGRAWAGLTGLFG